jgi:hypothetical protein
MCYSTTSRRARPLETHLMHIISVNFTPQHSYVFPKAPYPVGFELGSSVLEANEWQADAPGPIS